MSAINTSQQPTPPNVHTATKRAVATDVDPPGADDTSPVQQWLLFASNSAAVAPQDLFEDLASDEESPKQLSRRPSSKAASAALLSITPTKFSSAVHGGEDEYDVEAFESPPKRQKRAQSPGSSALPFSQTLLPYILTSIVNNKQHYSRRPSPLYCPLCSIAHGAKVKSRYLNSSCDETNQRRARPPDLENRIGFIPILH
jgi:hypothetical protein